MMKVSRAINNSSSFGLFTACAAVLVGGQFALGAAITQVPLGVTGFNADTIVDAADSPAPYSGPPASFPNGFQYSSTNTALSGVDNGAPSGSGDMYFQDGFYGATDGVPANGVVTSLATNSTGGNTVFNLAYDGTTTNFSSNNTLRFLSAGTSQTLSLTSPGKFATLDFLASAQNGGSTFDVTLDFHDGSSSTYTSAVSTGSGWAFSSDPSDTALEMPSIWQIGATTTYGWNGAMYESDITLSAADQAKTVDGVTFTATNLAGGASSEIYAISGAAAAVPEPASLGLITLAGVSLLGRRNKKA